MVARPLSPVKTLGGDPRYTPRPGGEEQEEVGAGVSATEACSDPRRPTPFPEDRPERGRRLGGGGTPPVRRCPSPPCRLPRAGYARGWVVRMVKYTAVFRRDGPWWMGYVEELPGANTQGRTLEEARENLREAVTLLLAANRALAQAKAEREEVVREELAV